MNGNDLLMASTLARQANEQMFRPISHTEFVRMEQARRARAARRAERSARRDARSERSRRRRAAVRGRVRLLLTPDIVERQAPALRP